MALEDISISGLKSNGPLYSNLLTEVIPPKLMIYILRTDIFQSFPIHSTLKKGVKNFKTKNQFKERFLSIKIVFKSPIDKILIIALFKKNTDNEF